MRANQKHARYGLIMKRNHSSNLIFSVICQLFVLWLFVSGTAQGATLNWTNTAGGNWNAATNWDPNQVPGVGDTAIITNAGNYAVSVDGNFYSVSNVALGGGAGGQVLVLSGSQFNCSGTITVGSGGLLTALQPSLQAAQINVSGTLTWTNGGTVSAVINVASNGVLNISGDTDRNLGENAAITNCGAVYWSGSGPLSARDDQSIAGSAAIVNMPGGVFEIQSDSTLEIASSIPFNNPFATVLFQNAGTLRKTGGTGTTFFFNVTFNNSGSVEMQQGTLFFGGFTGSFFTSSGSFQVNSGTAVQLSAGNFTFLPGHVALGAGFFGLSFGGQRTVSGIVGGRLDWTDGPFTGRLTIATNGVLNIGGNNEKVLDELAGITNYGAVYWSGSGPLSARDDQSIAGSAAIVNMPGGVFEIQSDSTLQIASSIPFNNPFATVLFQNAGTLRKTGGTGTTFFFNVTFNNSGSVEMQQGTLFFGGFTGSFFTSSGSFQVNSGTAVQLSAGNFTFLPGHVALGAGFFGLSFGGQRTVSGIVGGRLDWTDGPFTGRLTIATNGVLNIGGNNEKVLDELAGITNYGAVYWSGSGPLSARDDQSIAGSAAIVNMPGGVFEIQSDSTLQIASSIPFNNPFATVLFQNAGTLRKTGGFGITSFNHVQLSNQGSFEILSGSLAMDFGSVWTNTGTLTVTVSSTNSYTRAQTFGDANLTGTLDVEFLNGFLPAPGDSFELLTYNSTNVAFTNIILPSLPAGQYFSTLMDTQHVVVNARGEPIANADQFTLAEDTPTVLDVLANDNNLYIPGTIASFTQPSHGLLSLTSTNTLLYVPASNYFGSDSFSYQARNADGHVTSSASVSLTITPVNDAPIVAPLADQTVNEQTLLSFQASATDVENDQITFSLATGAPTGASIHPVTGVFSWTPSEAQGPANYSITVIATDNGTPPQSGSK